MRTVVRYGCMTTVASPPRFKNADDWLRSLGGVPLKRIIFDPWPGTATEADLLRLVARDTPCELIDGTLVEKPVGYWEALIAMNLALKLGTYVQATGAGAVSGGDATLRMASSNRIRLPDLSFISAERLPKTREPVPTVAPDLAVEVLSEGNTAAEMDQKLREYFQSGTRLAWFIDPRKRTVTVYHSAEAPTCVLTEADTLAGEQVVRGFAMPVADLFHNVPQL